MTELRRTSSADPEFIELVRQLDAYLAILDGDKHTFYDQFNKISGVRYALVASEGGHAVGCAAIKPFDDSTMEVKRMYVLPEQRGRGIASIILRGLEQWAVELGYTRCILETGKRQGEAIELYQRRGYMVIPNYGPYENIANSICFMKNLLS